MVGRRPLCDGASVLAASDQVWSGLAEGDWLEAFRSHPRIGQPKPVNQNSGQSVVWSEQEQREVSAASYGAKAALADANQLYEQKFKRIFIVCATGKTPTEILMILERRLKNNDATELQEAVEQQRLITHIRLRKWLQG
jgi:2-oxo-4-hydroxy-4-carboxy-5-ureidoimidazoline decarboxylase